MLENKPPSSKKIKKILELALEADEEAQAVTFINAKDGKKCAALANFHIGKLFFLYQDQLKNLSKNQTCIQSAKIYFEQALQLFELCDHKLG
jgi:hypothetical protein